VREGKEVKREVQFVLQNFCYRAVTVTIKFDDGGGSLATGDAGAMGLVRHGCQQADRTRQTGK